MLHYIQHEVIGDLVQQIKDNTPVRYMNLPNPPFLYLLIRFGMFLCLLYPVQSINQLSISNKMITCKRKILTIIMYFTHPNSSDQFTYSFIHLYIALDDLRDTSFVHYHIVFICDHHRSSSVSCPFGHPRWQIKCLPLGGIPPVVTRVCWWAPSNMAVKCTAKCEPIQCCVTVDTSVPTTII